MAKDLRQVDGEAAGAWIEPALGGGFGGQVRQQIPQIYEAYARIFHPASDEDGNEVSWGEVASRLGTTAHREMQWHAIVGTYDHSNFQDSRWPGGNPARSELADEKLDALCAILADHTATPERCLFGVSTIHGGVEEEFPDAPLLEMPHREFAVLAGPISAADQIEIHGGNFVSMTAYISDGDAPPPDPEPPARFWGQAPNLIWPEDRAWFVATEYDFDSTLVGGSRALIEALLAAPALEAWEVDGEVSLQCDADGVNPVPEPPPDWGKPQDPVELGLRSFAEWAESLNGEITVAKSEGGVLEIEVEPEDGWSWRLEAEGSDWSPADLSTLVSRTVENVELDPGTYAIRCALSGGPSLKVTPRAPAGGAPAEGDPPSWRLHLPNGLIQKHLPFWPWLFLELNDDATPKGLRAIRPE